MIKQLFKNRGLIYELAIRDIKLRYRKPYLGFFWMLIIPFCTALIYKILFSDFLHVTSGSYPFFIYLMTALLPWAYLTSSVQAATTCILGSKNIINQISFPKVLLPVSIVIANLITFLPAMLVLLLFLVIFNVKISLFIIFLPAVILIHTCLIVGLALLVSALQVIYRDVEYIVQILLMALFFSTPGVYMLEEVIDKVTPFFTKIYMLNPFVGILNLYRITIIGSYLEHLPPQTSFLNTLVIPVLFSIAILISGCLLFIKYEKKISDYINI